MSGSCDRRGLLLGAAALAAAGGAYALRPTQFLADSRPAVDLERQVPTSFSGWTALRGHALVLPNPEVQAALDLLYTQVLARSYGRDDGRMIMLSIAYGRNQSSESTAVHRPEFCYAAQGFGLETLGTKQVRLPSGSLDVNTLVATQGSRVEPILYWVTLDNRATLPGVRRKLTQIRMGLQGWIPDGMLVRVSSLTRTDRQDDSFEGHADFVRDLYASLDVNLRPRYFGS